MVPRETDAFSLNQGSLQRLFVAEGSRGSIADRGLIKARALLERQIEALLQTRVSLLNLLKEEANSPKGVIFLGRFLLYLQLQRLCSLAVLFVASALERSLICRWDGAWIKVAHDALLPLSRLFGGGTTRAQDLVLIAGSLKRVVFRFQRAAPRRALAEIHVFPLARQLVCLVVIAPAISPRVLRVGLRALPPLVLLGVRGRAPLKLSLEGSLVHCRSSLLLLSQL